MYGKQGEYTVANDQNDRQGNQQQGGQQRQGGQDQKQQNKSETQRKAEEAARKDKPGPGSVGTVGT
jgi:hypothetical protein